MDGVKRDTATEAIEQGSQDQKGGGKAAGKGANKLKGDKLTAAILKMLLMNAQAVRELRGAVYMVFMIDAEGNEYKKMKEQLVAYSEQVQETGKGHGLGPPSSFAFGGLLLSLRDRGPTIGNENLKGITEIQLAWENMSTEECFDMVPRCKLRKPYEKSLMKMELLVADKRVREVVRLSIMQTGARRLIGQAPEGGLEAALSKALTALNN